MINENQLERWASAPSEREEIKCQTAVSQIKGCIEKAYGQRVTIFLQGSYKNRTNVKRDSDVDIAVRFNEAYFANTTFLNEAEKLKYEQTRIPPSITFSDFKSNIYRMLVAEFGAGMVERKNKCLFIKANESRVNADVVPCFIHKRLATATISQAEGIQFISDNGLQVSSFPEQHYENGVLKNTATNQNFKSVVRILKNIRDMMEESRSIIAGSMPSFFLECLIWNATNNKFYGSYTEITKNIITQVWNDVRNPQIANDYAEISDLLWLFRGGQRNPKDAENFMLSAWNYLVV
jgi:predicted nucleotidyltransferase